MENLIFSENHLAGNPLDDYLRQAEAEMLDKVNQVIPVKKIMHKGDNLTKRLKMVLFERCLQAREIFGVSFDYSVFFDKIAFEKRSVNIYGLTD